MKKIFLLSFLVYTVLYVADAQTDPSVSKKIVTSTKGTGQTTGNIANITLTNHNDFPIAILPQTFFIPSDGKYQSYVGRIDEGNTIPPHGTTNIPVNGYCADIHTPPVPSGENMPPVNTWISVGNPIPPGITSNPPGITEPTKPPSAPATPSDLVMVPISNIEPIPTFNPSSIPGIIHSTVYKPESTPNPEIIITWPGTDIPVGGTLHPAPNPSIFAPVIVGVLEAIEKAVVVIQESGITNTPFSSNPEKERESIIQQTFWIYNSIITGKKYTKEDFANNTYNQFQNATGKTVASLPPKQKEEVDSGIGDFWNTYQATGIVAKVINAESPGITPEISGIAAQVEAIANVEMQTDKVADKTEKKKGVCSCDTMKIYFALNIKNQAGNKISDKEANQTVVFKNNIQVGQEIKIKARATNVEKGKTVELSVTPELKCTCSEAGIECKPGGHNVVIKHDKEELKKEFSLGAVPYEVKVTVSQTCSDDDCKEITCSATTTILIEKETEEQKKKREKKEKEAEEKEKKKNEKKN